MSLVSIPPLLKGGWISIACCRSNKEMVSLLKYSFSINLSGLHRLVKVSLRPDAKIRRMMISKIVRSCRFWNNSNEGDLKSTLLCYEKCNITLFVNIN